MTSLVELCGPDHRVRSSRRRCQLHRGAVRCMALHGRLTDIHGRSGPGAHRAAKSPSERNAQARGHDTPSNATA